MERKEDVIPDIVWGSSMARLWLRESKVGEWEVPPRLLQAAILELWMDVGGKWGVTIRGDLPSSLPLCSPKPIYGIDVTIGHMGPVEYKENLVALLLRDFADVQITVEGSMGRTKPSNPGGSYETGSMRSMYETGGILQVVFHAECDAAWNLDWSVE